MPFDQSPQQEVVLEPFSLEDIIAWLRTKEPTEHYCYTEMENCLLGQYVHERGGQLVASKTLFDTPHYAIGPHTLEAVPMWETWLGNVVVNGAHDFGAALRRAEWELTQKRREARYRELFPG